VLTGRICRSTPMGEQLPGLRDTTSAWSSRTTPNAVTELYFDDEDAFNEAFASEASRAAGDDVARHAFGRVRRSRERGGSDPP
jgi:hypothetical protein